MPDPGLVISVSGLVSVSTVNKYEAQRRRPLAGGNLGPANDGHHCILQSGQLNRFAKFPERINTICCGIHQRRVKIFLARLLLFGPAMMINRKKNTFVLFAGRTQIYCRFAAVAALNGLDIAQGLW